MGLPGYRSSIDEKQFEKNTQWLLAQLDGSFFRAMKDEPGALDVLACNLGHLSHIRRLTLADHDKMLIVAMVSKPGALFETLASLPEREISSLMVVHSKEDLPGAHAPLELQCFEFDRKSNRDIDRDEEALVADALSRAVRTEIEAHHPDFILRDFDRLLHILRLNNRHYVETSPAQRIARMLALYQQSQRGGGLHLDVEPLDACQEFRVHFAVANPPLKDFYFQITEVFKRLNLKFNFAHCLTISNGTHPYFLGTFVVYHLEGLAIERSSELFSMLRRELYNLQILGAHSPTYKQLVATGILNGMDASLVEAFIAFCHTNLAHARPDRFGVDDVRSAFYTHPDMVLKLIELFKVRFDPSLAEREKTYPSILADVRATVEGYNTGHRYLNEVRRAIFHCCLLFIQHTLKTNFFVLEKQALAFRLDPAYLEELGADYTGDLPGSTPFRITFFSCRSGFGNHIGFSDIARGGWRTVIVRSQDDLITNANTLFRENFVLAHTQHLKNKDIYEGGSKMVMLMDATDIAGCREGDLERWRLYQLQYAVINAFLDLLITENGCAKHPQVIDYYREEEPVELGPDENMHDAMIEEIARISRTRGYILGIGIMSSKEIGINHKQYGVTSAGVVKFAEITMAELGIDIRKDPFSLKLTGGPSGDVAGNAIRLFLERCPHVSFRLILDGTAALYDPEGADHAELKRILFKEDLCGFNPEALHRGGFILFRSEKRTEGFKELYRKVSKDCEGVKEEWISVDDLSRDYGRLIFSVRADLFIPAGGRPETIDESNWKQFFLDDGTPSAGAIIEGANSFLTPQARAHLQKHGVLVMRDASANKCGVISSSYEIIANLLFSEQEFLREKERYVADVLEILETVAEYEARLIFKRRGDNPALLCTEISDAISSEINGYYSRLFDFFQKHPDLCLKPLYRRAIIGHLPIMVQESATYRNRIERLPQKYLFAILAAEIASSIVYRSDRDAALEDEVQLHVARYFPPLAKGISHQLHRQTF